MVLVLWPWGMSEPIPHVDTGGGPGLLRAPLLLETPRCALGLW